MSIDDAIESGEWATAQALIHDALAVERDPAMLCHLFEVQVVTEQFEEAERTLGEITDRDATDSGTLEILAQCLRGDRLFAARRANPELVPEPDRFGSDVLVQAHRAALAHHARGEYGRARDLLRSARDRDSQPGGEVIDHSGIKRRFMAVTDADELTGPYLVCTTVEGICEVPFHRVRRLEIGPGATPPDLFWRPAVCWLRGEEEPLVVRIPALYPGTGRHPEPDVRSARLCVKDYGRGYAIASGPRALAFKTEHGWRVDRFTQFAKLVFDG
jgi:protein involved in temperature-dependent protein secretion